MRNRELLDDFSAGEGPKRRLTEEDLGVLGRATVQPEPFAKDEAEDGGRRQHPRVEHNRQVSIWVTTPGFKLDGPHTAKTLDVSRGGMRFSVRGRWAMPGLKLILSHELTEGPLYGEVIRVRRGWTQTEVAVRFEKIPDELFRVIRRSLADQFVWAA